MNHSKVRARMNDYLERRLPPLERSQVAAHLAECPDCSRELRELKDTVAVLRGLPDPEPPPALADSVMARVRAGEAEAGGLLPWVRRLSAPAVAVPLALGLAGLVLFAGLRGQILPQPPAESQPVARLGADDVLAPQGAARHARLEPLGPRAAFRGGASPEARASLAKAQLQMLREMQRGSLALRLTRHGGTVEVARMLRGAGHPYSPSLASHLEEHDYPSVTMVDWSAR